MSRGNTLSDGGNAKIWVVGPFTKTKVGATTANWTSSDEVALFHSTAATGATVSSLSEVAIPFPCRIVEVAVAGELLAIGDDLRIRVQRYDSDPNAAHADVLSNCYTAPTVIDYLTLVTATVNQYKSIQYTGVAQTAGSACVGFVEAQAHFDAGDYLRVTGQHALTADSTSHLQVYVTFVKDV